MLSIIVVNWNAGQQLADAVTSIAQYHHNLVSSVIIVDNASTDDSLARVEALTGLRFQLKIIRNSETEASVPPVTRVRCWQTAIICYFLIEKLLD